MPWPWAREGPRFVAAVYRCRRPHDAGCAPPRDGLCRAARGRSSGRRARSLAELLPVDATLALFCRTFMVAMRLWAVADPKSDASIGVGAFNLVRREALHQSQGFAWLRMEVGDDLGLGMMLKQSGARSCLVNAHSLLGLHWYRTLREMAHGAEKAYASAARCSLARVVLLAIVLVAMEWAPLVVLACGAGFRGVGQVPGLLWSGTAMLAAAVGSSVILARWSKSRLLPALLLSPCGPRCGRHHAAERLAGVSSRRDRLARNALSEGSVACRPASEDSLALWSAVACRRFSKGLFASALPSRSEKRRRRGRKPPHSRGACPTSPHKLQSRLKPQSSL